MALYLGLKLTNQARSISCDSPLKPVIAVDCMKSMWVQVLKHIGELGPYQITLYTLLCIPGCLPAAFLAFSQVREKIKLIESNAKCCYLKKLTCKGSWRQVFICLKSKIPAWLTVSPVYKLY
jgi:hypothetical protein